MRDRIGENRSRVTTRHVHVALTIVGTGGLVLNVLPFGFDYVPIRDAYPGGFLAPSWLGVWPCMVLPLPIVIGYALWLARGVLPRSFSIGGYALAIVSAGSYLVGVAPDLIPGGARTVIYPVLLAVPFCAAAGLVFRGLDRDRNAGCLIAMQAVYVGQIQFWLAFVANDLQTGAWLGVVTALAYLGQISLIARRRSWVILLIAPSVVWAFEVLAAA